MRIRIAILAAMLMTGSAAATVTTPAAQSSRVIVTLDADAPPARAVGPAIAADHGGRVLFVFEHALNGFVAEMPAGRAAALARHPHVAAVEPDVIVSIAQTAEQVVPTGYQRADADLATPPATMDVDIAIIDTGIALHPDLNLRYVIDCTPAIFYPLFGGCSGTDYFDANGHGTHVAGSAAAYDNDIGVVGIAPGASLWSVKVLGADGTGYLGSIVAGVDIVAQHSDQIDVANMSLAGGFQSEALDTAIAGAVAKGVLFAIAAGNDGANLDQVVVSPAGHPDALTVSALSDGDGLPGALSSVCHPGETDDTLATFSNYGSVVDIAAPGVCILSTHLNNGYATYSGTSMASPHVAGALARWMVVNNTNPANAAQVHAAYAALMADAIPQGDPCGFTGDPDPYSEGLLFVNGPAFGGDGTCGDGAPPPPPPPPDDPPTVSWTSPTGTVSGNQPIAINATDAEDASGSLVVQWRVDGGDWQNALDLDGDDVYVASWDTTTSANGPVTLEARATDSAINTGTATSTVTVDNPVPNQPPTASFTAFCDGLTCTFDASASDDDAGIVSYDWTFGDGASATTSTSGTNHSYGAGGPYTVVLVVYDGEGLSDSTSVVVNPSEATPTMVLSEVTATYRGKKQNQAHASVTVIESPGGQPVSGATVDGIWTSTSGFNLLVTGTTASDGSVGFNTGKLPKGTTDLLFCVVDVLHPDYEYDSTGGTFICANP